jgi:hypothetical protein
VLIALWTENFVDAITGNVQCQRLFFTANETRRAGIDFRASQLPRANFIAGYITGRRPGAIE